MLKSNLGYIAYKYVIKNLIFLSYDRRSTINIKSNLKRKTKVSGISFFMVCYFESRLIC